MWALTTKQGTAMAETALCNSDVWSGSNKGKAQGAAGMAGDWDGNPQMTDCSENEALECIVCGDTIFTEAPNR